VAVTSPAAGAEVHERNILEVTASVSGEVRVTSVQFLVNGQPAATDYAAPYTYSFRVPAGAGPLTLGAMATDIAGHQTTAAPVVIQVVPDDKPTAALLAPVAGSRFSEGVTITLAATATDDVQVAAVEFFVDGVSQGTRTAEPYQVSYTIPLGKTQATIRAVATDSAGQTATTSDVTVGVDPDPPPVVTVLDPPAGATVVEGAQITVSVGATDNTAITQVQLSIGGQPPLQKTSPPYTFSVDVPLGAGQLSFTASATDTVGHVSTATSTLNVTADPLTTAVGRVLDPAGNPVAGAHVASGAVTGTTLVDGTFSLPGLPTTRSIVVSASATIAGTPQSGRSLATPPVPSGTTYVGDITLRKRAVVGYYDLDLNRGNPSQVAPIQVAGFDAVDVGNLSTADLSGIDILFAQNPNNSVYSSVYVANLPKIFTFIQNGGILVFHDREVTDAAKFLPGSPGQIVRDFSDGANIDILDNTTKVTNGPGGILTNTSLDGGTSSSHGYAVSSTLPADARRIFSQTDPQRVVLFSYGFGQGKVIYATIPLDYYLSSFGPPAVNVNMGIYAANVLAYANDLR